MAVLLKRYRQRVAVLLGTATTFILLSLLVTANLRPSKVEAQVSPPTPFSCDGSAYVVQGTDGQFMRLNGAPGSYTFESIGGPFGYQLNAIGYNPADNFVYGWAFDPSGAQLMQLDATGTLTLLGVPDVPAGGTFPLGWNTAAFHATEPLLYMLYQEGDPLESVELWSVDLSDPENATASSIPLVGVEVLDFAVNPTNGLIYSVQTPGGLVEINPATGDVREVPFGDIPAGAYGAVWFTQEGTLVVYRNAGTIFEIDISDFDAPELLETQDDVLLSGQNDGASCVRASEADLGVSKEGNPAEVEPGDGITYAIQVANNGLDVAENVLVEDHLPEGAGYLSASGEGWDCLEASGIISCTREALMVGDAPEITVQITAPLVETFTTIVNVVEVSSETGDSEPDNNFDEVSTDVTPTADPPGARQTATPTPTPTDSPESSNTPPSPTATPTPSGPNLPRTPSAVDETDTPLPQQVSPPSTGSGGLAGRGNNSLLHLVVGGSRCWLWPRAP